MPRKTMKHSMNKSTQFNKSNAIYEIKVQGLLDLRWEQWFEGMTLTTGEETENGSAYTLIQGPVNDQAALHGLLVKIRDLNLTLISVRRVLPEKNERAK